MTKTEKAVNFLRKMREDGLTLDDLIDAIEEVAKSKPVSGDSDKIKIKRDENLEQIITEIIHEIGIPAKVNGHEYIRRSIELIYINSEVKHNIVKKVYFVLAEEFDTTAYNIERCIRRAIEIAWDRGNTEILEKYFGYTVSKFKGRPTNLEFLAMIADYIRMQYNL